ncbi:hypothetical protein RSAG8_01139, partial [Rhizoctonia solani AG-8 WAC10335]
MYSDGSIYRKGRLGLPGLSDVTDSIQIEARGRHADESHLFYTPHATHHDWTG